jgi:hypothetical protein
VRTRLSIQFHELTGTLTTAAFLALNDVLKAAAEEKRRVRAATDFMVVEFDVAFNFLERTNFMEQTSSEVADNNLSSVL